MLAQYIFVALPNSPGCVGIIEGDRQYRLYPSLKEQTKVIRVISELEGKVESLESFYQQKLDALKELKKSLLHQAFIGEL